MLPAMITAPVKQFRSLPRLLGELRTFRRYIAVILVLGLLYSVVQPFALKLTQQIIDGLQKGGAEAFFKTVPLQLVLLFVVSGVAKYFYNTLRRNVTERVVLKMRQDLFKKYLEFPQSVIDQGRTGDMLSSLQNDLAQTSGGIDTMCDVFKEPLVFIGLFSMAVYWDWKLALVTLIAAPLVAFLFSVSGSAVKRYSGRNLRQFSDLISLSQETLSGSRVVKVFQMEMPLLEKFKELQAAYFKTIWKSIKVQELATPTVELIGACLIGGVVLYGRYRISHGEMTTGQLIAFVFALGLCQMPLKQLNNAYLKLKNAEAALDRIYAVLDTPIPKLQRSGARRWEHFESSIKFENVGLHYGDKQALSHINLEVKSGDCIALVGPSGSGKTSIVNLLPRLYEVTEGALTIDGMDVKDIHVSDLRAQISFVTQDIFLFNDTLYENIRFGRPTATKAEVEKAAEMAHCLAFIEKCPGGFESRIGERGVRLSGGERQRLAIARAFLKGAPILVLDEATSSLDSHSEQMVQNALDELMVGKTTFLVAHRFSTIRRAQRIYVLDHGKIHEEGAHANLVGNNGLYSRLYHTQAGLPLS